MVDVVGPLHRRAADVLTPADQHDGGLGDASGTIHLLTLCSEEGGGNRGKGGWVRKQGHGRGGG